MNQFKKKIIQKMKQNGKEQYQKVQYCYCNIERK